MKKILSLALLLGASVVQAAPSLSADYPLVAGELGIAHTRYQLANGLTVILAPDHSDPLVHVDITYHVGSARESLGKSGFAHFFEHMMFQGSKHVAGTEHLRLISEAGGTLNGSTNRDRTNYYQTVPANQLEKVLWLEADRMGFLLDAVSQAKFEVQRATVKNERAQRVDNQPYGLVYEKLNEALYPREHPYSWQPIGYVEDLDRVDVGDLKQFFLRWYGPNNATLTIGGDFDRTATLALIEKYFGPIPRGPAVADPAPQPVRLSASRYVTLEDKVHLPLLYISYPTVALGAADEAPLDLLADVLGGSKSSRLYRALVDTGLALDVSASHHCEELACSFDIYAYANLQTQGGLSALRRALMQTVDAFATQPVTQAELDKAVNSARASTLWGLGSVAGKVSKLAAGHVLAGDANLVFKQLDAYARVTPSAVLDAYQQFIAQQPSVNLSVVPHGKTAWQAAAPNFNPAPRPAPAARSEPFIAPQAPRIVDNFDRAQVPPSQGAIKAPVPAIWRANLPLAQTGSEPITLLGHENHEIGAVSLLIALPGGLRAEQAGEEGLAELTATMLEQGTRQLDKAALSDKLREFGASIQFSAAQYSNLITVKALANKLPETLALVEQMWREPRFAASDFARVQTQTQQSLQQARQQPEWQARQAFEQLVYGASSRLGQPEAGTPEQVARFTLADVQRFYQKFYHPSGAKVVLVGDVQQAQARAQLAFLTRWQGEVPRLGDLPAAAPAAPGIYLIDKPNAPQSVIRFGRRALPFAATGDYFLNQLMNFNLGGNFNSRLNMKLREEKGYTYGISTRFSGNREVGVWQGRADVNSEATAAALGDIIRELRRYHASGPTATELRYLKSAVSQQDALAYETLSDKAGLLLQMVVYGLEPAFIAEQSRLIDSASRADLAARAKRWLDPRAQIFVVVGDKARLEKSLRQLNLPIHAFAFAAPSAP
ncbi:MAG: M16 family metallopeptidase [Aeromonas sp.]